MNLYEKTVAQMERKEVHHKYLVRRVPLTDKAKKKYGVYEYNDKEKRSLGANLDTVMRIMKIRKKETKIEFDYAFYYNDLNETEDQRKEVAIRKVLEIINIKDADYAGNPLKYNDDFKLVIEKVNLTVGAIPFHT